MFFTSRKPVLRRISILLIVSQLLPLSSVAYANPRGATVVHGGVGITEAGAVMTIRQSTERAIVNWQGFSNAAGETVRFQQPGATSAILNRVTGADASVINGAMQANGRVFLINPNGVVFGKTASVNTGGLVASTLQMTDGDFKSGSYRLKQDPSKPLRAVVNQGTIQASAGGSVALVAPLVNNEGTISAPGGKVALAAGTNAVVTLDDQGLVNLGVRETAPGAVVVSRDAVSDVLSQAVNNRHIAEAGSSSTNDQGEIVLGGAEGLAMNQGTISVSAAAAGQGGAVRLHSTQASVLAPGSAITANGAGTGAKGGDVRVLSDGNTRFLAGARLEARGGPSGKGGFLEVSGARGITVAGEVDARAPDGQAGTFLIDPANITIVGGSGTNVGTVNVAGSSATVPVGQDPGVDYTIFEQYLEDLVSVGGVSSITLEATNSITVGTLSDGVLNLGAAGLALTAGAGGISFTTATDRITANNVTLSASGPLSLGGIQTSGAINATTSSGDITLNNTVRSTAGVVVLTATTGSILDNNATGNDVQGTNLTLTAGGSIGASGNPMEVDATGALTLSTTGVDGSIFVAEANTITALNVSVGFDSAAFGGEEVRVTANGRTFAVEPTAHLVSLDDTLGASLTYSDTVDTMNVGFINDAGQNVVLNANGAGGAILDGNGTSAVNVRGAALTLSTAGAIGSAGTPLETDVTQLTATASAGGLFLSELDTVTANGIQLNSISAGGGAGAVTISSTSSIQDDGLQGTVIAGGIVTLNAGTSIGATGASNDIDLTATRIVARSGQSAGDDTAPIFLRSTGAIAVDIRADENGTVDDVTLAALGSITEVTNDTLVDILGGTVSLSQQTAPSGSIGAAGNHVDIDATTISVNNIGGGASGIRINDIDSGGSQTLANLSLTARSGSGADIEVLQDNGTNLLSLTAGAVLAGSATGVNVTMSRVNGMLVLGNLTALSATITASSSLSQAGGTTLTATSANLNSLNGSLTANTAVSSLQAQAAAGAMTITNTSAALTVTSATTVGAGSNDISITTSGGLALGVVNAVANSVQVIAGGAITDANDGVTAGTDNITGGTISLSAGTGIGSGGIVGEIEVAASLLSAVSGTNVGDQVGTNIFLSNTDASVSIGVLSADADAGATPDAVNLRAAGAVLDGDGADDGSPVNNVTGSAFNLLAGTSLGASGGGTLETTVGILNITATGDVFLANTGTLTSLTAASAGSTIVISSSGGITLQTVNTGAGTGSVSLTSTNGAILDGNDPPTSTANITTGAVTLSAGLNIGTDTSFADERTGQVEINASSLTASSGTLAGDDAAPIYLNSRGAGTLALNLIAADADGTHDAFTLRASGPVSDNNGAANNVDASTFIVQSPNSIGASDALETTIDTLRATASGQVEIEEASGLIIGAFTAASSSGRIKVNGGTLTQEAGGTVQATSLLIEGTATANTLTNALNDVDVLAAAVSGTLDFHDKDALTIGTVLGVAGITNTASTAAGRATSLQTDGTLVVGQAINLGSTAGTGGTLALNVGDTISSTGSGVITADRLEIRGSPSASGAGGLTNAANAYNTLAMNITGGIALSDSIDLTVGETSSIFGASLRGITATGDVILSGPGAGRMVFLDEAVNVGTGNLSITNLSGVANALTQDAQGLITAAGLRVVSLENGSVVLSGSNAVSRITGAVNGGLTFNSTADLAVDTVTIATVPQSNLTSTNDDISLTAPNISVVNNLSAGSSVVTLIATTGSISGNGTIAARDLSLRAVNGDIGTSATPIRWSEVTTNNSLTVTDGNVVPGAGANNVYVTGAVTNPLGVDRVIANTSVTLTNTLGLITDRNDSNGGTLLVPGDDTLTPNVVAPTITLSSATGLGADTGTDNLRLGELELVGTALSLSVTNGSVLVNNTNAAATTLNSLSAGGAGSVVRFVQLGGGSLQVDAFTSGHQASISTDGGNLNLVSASTTNQTLNATIDGAGSLTLGTIALGTGTFNASVGGAILDGNDVNGGSDTDGSNDTINDNVTAGIVSLVTGTNIGTETTVSGGNALLGEIEVNASGNVTAVSGNNAGDDDAPIYLAGTNAVALRVFAVATDGDAGGSPDDVRLRSAGSILDTNDGGTPIANIAAGNVTLIANGGVGAVTPTLTDGELEVKAFGVLNVTSGAAAGDQAGAGIYIHSFISSSLQSLSLGLVSADADGTRDDVTIRAASLTDGNAAGLNIVGATATLLASTSIGTSAGGGEIDTDVTALTASSGVSGDGDIVIGEANGVALNVVNAFADGAGTAGIVTIVAGGAITDGNGAALNVTGGALTLQAATGIGAGDAVETSVASVTLSSTTGDIEISEASGLAVTSIATAGNVRLKVDAGALTQTGAITAAGLLVQGGATSSTLMNASNDVATLAAAITGGSLAYRDANALTVATVLGVDGITTTGASTTDHNVALQTGGALTTNRRVDVGTSTTTGGTIAFNVGGLLSQDGISGDGTVGAWFADGLELRGAVNGANLFALNRFNRISGSWTGTSGLTDNVSLLTVGSNTTIFGTTTGITAAGNPNMSLANVGGKIFLDEAINVGTGNVVLLTAMSAAADSISQDAQGIITAFGLRMLTQTEGGGVILDAANQVDRIQGRFQGDVTFTSARTLAVNQVVTANDLLTTGDTVRLSAPSINLAQSIDTTNAGGSSAANVTLRATGGNIAGTGLVRARDLDARATGDIGASGAFVQYAQSNGGKLVVTDVAGTGAGAANVFVNGTTGLTLGQVIASSAVRLTATGMILDGNDSNNATVGTPGDDVILTNVTAPTISLVATTGIGADTAADNARLGQIELRGTTISNLQVSTSGNILVNNTNAAATTVTSISASGAGTPGVLFDQLGGGALIVSSLSANDQNVSLSTDGGALTLGTISIATNRNLSLAVGGTADLTLGVITLGTGSFSASAGGSILDGNDSNNGTVGTAGDDTIANNITAGSVTLTAGNSIGTFSIPDDQRLGEIEITTGGTLTATTGAAAGDQTGGIYVAGLGSSLSLGVLSADANGTPDEVRLRSAGSILDGNDSDNGTAGTPGDDGIVNNITGGDIVLIAGANVGAETSGNNALLGEVEVAAISLAALSGVTAGDQVGAGIYLANTDATVALNNLEADNDAVANRDEVRLRAAGAITDSNLTSLNLAGTTLTIIAGGDVGNGGAGALETQASVLNVSSTNGTVQIANTVVAGAPALTTATLTAGGTAKNVTFSQAGDALVSATSSGGVITLSTTASVPLSIAGDLTLDTVTTGTTGGSVSLTAAGAILDGNDASTAGTANVITGGNVSITSNGVGADTSGTDALVGELELDTGSASVLTIASGQGNGDQNAAIYVAEVSGDLTIQSIQADTFSTTPPGTPDPVRVRAQGAIIAAGGSASVEGSAVELIAGTGIGAGAAIELVASSIDAVSATGNIELFQDGSLDVKRLSTSGDVRLSNTLSGSSFTQSGLITAANLHVSGSGTFALHTQANVLTSVTAALTGTAGGLSLREANGFSIGAAGLFSDDTSVSLLVDAGTITVGNAINLDANGSATVGNLTLNGATSQTTGVITANVVTLAQAGVAYDLGAQNNALGSVTGSGTAISVRDDAGFAVGALTGTTSVALSSNGAVSQTGVLDTPLLTLSATTSGAGDFDLGTQSNVLGMVSSTGTVNTVSLRDDASVALGSLAVDTTLTLDAAGVTQTGALTGGANVSLVAGGAKSYALGNAGNDFGTVSSTGAVSALVLRDDTAFSIGTLTAASVTLQTEGTVSQSGVLTATTATLTASTSGSGDFTLNTQANVLGTVSSTNTVNTASIRDDGGFTVAGLAADTTVRLQSSGTVTQTGAIAAPSLVLRATTAGLGNFQLASQNNALGTVTSTSVLDTVALRDDAGFTLGALATDASLALQSDGTVNQTAAFAAPTFSMSATTSGAGDFVLDTHSNSVNFVSTTSTVNTIALRDDDGFPTGDITADTSIRFQTDGIIEGGGGVATTPLMLLTATTAGEGVFDLPGSGIGTIASTNLIDAVAVEVSGNLVIAGIAADRQVVLDAGGTVTQTGAITGGGILRLRSSVDGVGDFALASQNNDVGTVVSDNPLNTVAFRDDDGFVVGRLSVDTTIALQSDGTVSQDTVGNVSGGADLVLTATTSGAGDFDFSTRNNIINSVSTTNTVNSLAVNDSGGLSLGATAVDSTVLLMSDGAVTQSAALTGNAAVTLLYTFSSGTGDFTLTHAGNAILSVRSLDTVNTVAVRDDSGFAVGALAADTSIALTSNGTVTQSGAALATPTLVLAGGTTGAGTFRLDTVGANAIDTVSTANQVSLVAVRDDAGLTAGDLSAATSVTLQSNGAVTQAAGASIVTPGLALGGTGSFTITNAGNTIATLAGSAGAVTYIDADAIAIGIVDGFTGLAATGAVSITGVTGITVSSDLSGSTVALTATDSTGTLGGAATVTAGTATLSAQAGIDLNLAAQIVSATNTAGGITLDNVSATAVTVDALTQTGAGDITYRQTGAGAVSFTVVSAQDGSTVTLDATGAIGVGAVDAGATGVVDMTSGGAINDDNADTLNITAMTANLSGASIGTETDLLDIEVGGNTLHATASTGGIFVSDPTNLVLGTITAPGNVMFRAGGDLLVNTLNVLGGGGFTAGGTATFNTAVLGGDVDVVAGGNLAGAMTGVTLRLVSGGVIGQAGTPFVVTAQSVFVDADQALGGVAVQLSGGIADGMPQVFGDSLPSGSFGYHNGVQFFPAVVPTTEPTPVPTTPPPVPPVVTPPVVADNPPAPSGPDLSNFRFPNQAVATVTLDSNEPHTPDETPESRFLSGGLIEVREPAVADGGELIIIDGQSRKRTQQGVDADEAATADSGD